MAEFNVWSDKPTHQRQIFLWNEIPWDIIYCSLRTALRTL